MPVRPRVISPLTGEAILAADAIAALLDEGHRGTVQLLGDAGAGKSTAIAYLAEVFAGREDVGFFDVVKQSEVAAQASTQLVVFTSSVEARSDFKLQLAPWGTDEWIEYLLAEHPNRCASVMRRLNDAVDRSLAAGLPELWRLVLDRMAGDESVRDIRSALRRALYALLTRKSIHQLCGDYCLAGECGAFAPPDSIRLLEIYGGEPLLLRLLRHRSVRRLLAADRLVTRLAEGDNFDHFKWPLPRELVAETGRRIGDDADALKHVVELATGDYWALQPMAASIVFAHDRRWKPATIPRNLTCVYLDGISWPGANLSGVELSSASLNRADLTQARFDGTTALSAQFNRASLRGALLNDFKASGAGFWRADLSEVVAKRADFATAQLQQADLSEAELISANFQGADLSGACLSGANLADAFLVGAEIADADFTNADLGYTRLKNLSLRQAKLAGANLAHAQADGCDLEYVELAAPDFSWASLVGAYLTGSVLPGANFQHADLHDAGLADVQWEDADLRQADLRRCSFHMGSSRSGLVDSPFPSHGTRTGFYTDDYDEQHFKAPEQIRKANLRGADLRGARIDDVDFYLVDLRDAIYDDEQESHFRKCGAILYSRV